MKFKLPMLLVAIYFVSFAAVANEEYVCNFGDDKRLISIYYESEYDQVPCQVQYDKGQGLETLWNAQAEVGYCESKAVEFVARQESWGWSCSRVTNAEYVEEVQAALDQ